MNRSTSPRNHEQTSATGKDAKRAAGEKAASGEAALASAVDGLTDARFDLPANTPVRGSVARALQSTHGNAYVQRLMGTSAPKASPRSVPAEVSQGIESKRGSGSPLPDDVRDEMEPAFGRSFEDVRLHTDPMSAGLASSLDARAFTTGSDIFFKEGAYNPASGEGKKTLAHELTHVAQNAAATTEATQPVSQPEDSAEQEAAAVGLQATEPPSVLTAPAASVQRDPALPEPGMEGELFDTGGLSDRMAALSASADLKYDAIADYSGGAQHIGDLATEKLNGVSDVYKQAYKSFNDTLESAERQAMAREAFVEGVVGLVFAAVMPSLVGLILPAAASTMAAAARSSGRSGARRSAQQLDMFASNPQQLDMFSVPQPAPTGPGQLVTPTPSPAVDNALRDATAFPMVEGNEALANQAAGQGITGADTKSKRVLDPTLNDLRIAKEVARLYRTGLEYNQARDAMKDLSSDHRDFRLEIERYGRTGELGMTWEELNAEVETLEIEDEDLNWVHDEIEAGRTALNEIGTALNEIDPGSYTSDQMEKAIWIQWIAGLDAESTALGLSSIELRLRELKLADFGHEKEDWKFASAIGVARAKAALMSGQPEVDAAMVWPDYMLYLDPMPWNTLEPGEEYRLVPDGDGYDVQEKLPMMAVEDWQTTFVIVPEGESWIAYDIEHDQMRRRLTQSDVDRLGLFDPTALQQLKAAPAVEQEAEMYGPEEANASTAEEGVIGYDALGPIHEDDPNRL